MSFIVGFFNNDGEKSLYDALSFILSVSVLANRIRGLRRQLLPETRCCFWGALAQSAALCDGGVRFALRDRPDTAIPIHLTT